MKIKTSMIDDSELLELLKNGDSKGFKEIHLKTFRSVSSYVNNNSGNFEDAQDLFQDGMIAFLNNIRKPEFQLSSSIQNYFLSIVRNLWLLQLRNNKMKHVENLDGLSEQWIQLMDSECETMELENERQEKLAKQFEVLGVECKTLLTEYYYFNKSLDEISKKMNYPYDFIKVKKFRCMKELKNKMINDK
ncbi:MAG: sigma-70 family RNA polymerase sigma factor [Saprospiraceae bacterium]|nr:sigma-70 family RNA polymerase sigma factor [Saprospiraceae bacterium]